MAREPGGAGGLGDFGDFGGVGRSRGPRGLAGRAAWGLRAYGLIAAMWIRSTMAYRFSFVVSLLVDAVATFFDFVVIWLMFTHVRGLGGFSFAEVAFLYGTTGTAFGLADLAVGQAEKVGRRVRDGTLDALLVRPAPVLAQVAADRFALRRLGRVTQGLLVLVWSLVVLDGVEWTPLTVAMVPLMTLTGAVIFGSLMTAGAAFQFWAQDGAQVTNAFTHGGNTLLQYPPSVFAGDLVRGVVYVVPLAFVNWVPALYVLGRDAPAGLPPWAAFAPPLVAAACVAVAGLAWRAGLRAYRSTGS
ncbi:ABC transporter permease [Streptomyces sp. DH12]|uniref:ABC transporter permease n=1 Tax=Streptomyces sp. DH12 TaxID=2857010 RepID=UPI001E3DEDAC|nr:ABC transporter permease [Streptomyces sp. DH12]